MISVRPAAPAGAGVAAAAGADVAPTAGAAAGAAGAAGLQASTNMRPMEAKVAVNRESCIRGPLIASEQSRAPTYRAVYNLVNRVPRSRRSLSALAQRSTTSPLGGH